MWDFLDKLTHKMDILAILHRIPKIAQQNVMLFDRRFWWDWNTHTLKARSFVKVPEHVAYYFANRQLNINWYIDDWCYGYDPQYDLPSDKTQLYIVSFSVSIKVSKNTENILYFRFGYKMCHGILHNVFITNPNKYKHKYNPTTVDFKSKKQLYVFK